MLIAVSFVEFMISRLDVVMLDFASVNFNSQKFSRTTIGEFQIVVPLVIAATIATQAASSEPTRYTSKAFLPLLAKDSRNRQIDQTRE